MIHRGHVAHAHVLHRRERASAQRRNRSDHPDARRERGARHAGPVPGLGDERVGDGRGGFDDHVIGFGDRDLELVDRDGAHVLAIGLHDRHLQSRNTDVEIGHRRGVDDA